MKIINHNNQVTVPLFHGTSTLFVDSILKNGLGAVNPLKDWKVYELSTEVYKLSQTYLQDTELFKNRIESFTKIIEQTIDGKMNYQHGDTYLAATERTAANYAISNQHGSEYLSCTLEFLNELLKLDNSQIVHYFKIKYPKAVELIDIKPTPVLIRVENINQSSLKSEQGESPEANLKKIDSLIELEKWRYDIRLDQCNFRLILPIQSTKDLQLWHITEGNVDGFITQYKLKLFN